MVYWTACIPTTYAKRTPRTSTCHIQNSLTFNDPGKRLRNSLTFQVFRGLRGPRGIFQRRQQMLTLRKPPWAAKCKGVAPELSLWLTSLNDCTCSSWIVHNTVRLFSVNYASCQLFSKKIRERLICWWERSGHKQLCIRSEGKTILPTDKKYKMHVNQTRQILTERFNWKIICIKAGPPLPSKTECSFLEAQKFT